MQDELRIERGGAGDAEELLRLFDEAVAWLVARGQTGQWGSEPFSAVPTTVKRVQAWASNGGLAFAATPEGERVGAIVLGDHPAYVPAPERPEVYVQVLLTAPRWRNRGVGAALIAHADAQARHAHAEQVRVDCWDGVPELPRQYERLGFTRVGSFDVNGWSGAILVRVP